ncbi:MAG: baseplate protein [Desulfobacteraceae bacterium]|nr:MAG: baseplate protein [Desulfobacteraceae bacterium]
MTTSDFLGKGWKFPVATEKDTDYVRIAFSEGEESIRESILIILGTVKGERVMRPDFGCGIHELVFAPNNTSTATMVTIHVKEALLKWEPRIEVLNVSAAPDREEGNRLNVDIEYKIKTINTKRNLVYPFYLESTQG